MNKAWVVARREYHTTIRTKSFIIAILMMPIFMSGSIAFQKLTRGRIDVEPKRIGVIDHSGGAALALIQEASAQRKEPGGRLGMYDESGKQIRPEFEFVAAIPEISDPDEQRLEMSNRIRNREFFAFIEIGADILDKSATGDAGIEYYSDRPTFDDVTRWLEYAVNDRIRERRLGAAGLDKAVVMKALTPLRVENLGLLSRTPDGKIEPAKKVDRMQTFMIPFGLLMLMWIAITMTMQPLLLGVIEEKMQKISEVLLGSIRPFDLMMGKLLGYVAVAITLVGIYLLGGYAVARQFGYGHLVPLHLMGWFIVFQSLAILMYGSLFLAVGACCTEIREAQNYVLPIWLVLVIPFFTLSAVLEHPSSQFATLLSLFPPATPMIMMTRMAIPPSPPLWQPLVGIAGCLLATLICVWAAGRIFRVGLLLQGKAPKMGEMLRWVVHG